MEERERLEHSVGACPLDSAAVSLSSPSPHGFHENTSVFADEEQTSYVEEEEEERHAPSQFPLLRHLAYLPSDHVWSPWLPGQWTHSLRPTVYLTRRNRKQERGTHTLQFATFTYATRELVVPPDLVRVCPRSRRTFPPIYLPKPYSAPQYVPPVAWDIWSFVDRPFPPILFLVSSSRGGRGNDKHSDMRQCSRVPSSPHTRSTKHGIQREKPQAITEKLRYFYVKSPFSHLFSLSNELALGKCLTK